MVVLMKRLTNGLAIVLSFLLLFPSLARAAQPAPAANSAPVAGDVQLLRADEQGISLALDTADYTVETVDGVAGKCQRIRVPGYAQSGETGAPQLPVKVVLLGVPPQAKLSLTATPGERVIASTSFHACPAPQAVVEQGEGEVVRYEEQAVAPAETIYSRNARYPAQTAVVHDLGNIRSQRLVRLEISPFQVNPTEGTLIQSRRIQVRIDFDGSGAVGVAAVAEEPAFERLLQSTLLNYASARSWRGQPIQAAANFGWQPPQPAYRVAVDEEGLYRLTRADLVAAGLPIDRIDPSALRLFNNGQEVAIRVVDGDNREDSDGSFDSGDQLLFYGQGVDERYTGTNIYWLTYGASIGLRMVQKVGNGGGSSAEASAIYTAVVHSEENSSYVSSLPKEPGYDHWYGRRVTAAGAGNPGRQDLSLDVSNLPATDPATGALTATLGVALAGNVRGVHHLRLYVNDQPVYDGRWTGRTYREALAEFPQSTLVEGKNSISVELVNDTEDQPFDMAYIDWIDLHYQRNLVARSDQLLFESPSPGAWRYTVGGFSHTDLELYDVTDPARVSRIDASVADKTLVFEDNQSNSHRYLALSQAQRRSPLSVHAVSADDLLSSANGADYLIIAPSDFVDAVQPLARYRAGQGYRVRVVDVQTIYDQFNYGRVSAQAIQDFLAYTYDHWTGPAPAYVLLVGDGTYDPRHYLETSAATWIPPYLAMADPELGETAADNRYVAVAGDDWLPDMHLGRLPAQSVADVEAMVEKTLTYEQVAATDGWNRNVLFVADNTLGGGGVFRNFSDSVADGSIETDAGSVPLLPAVYAKTKVYLGKNCSEEQPEACRQQIIDRVNQGALLVSYVGHGTKSYWAEEQLLNLAALDRLSNGDRLSIFLPMTCLEGYYQEAEAGQESFGESAVRRPAGGAVASWSPTGLGLVTGHDYLEKGLFKALFHDGVQDLGQATTQGKLYLLANAPSGKYDDLLDTYVLFGDPALHVDAAVESRYHSYLPLLVRD